mmetsp:Transcript_27631/g.42842  ORF Transcript_27631/g.42842 Transcript_27631/m.42842 type:complete len:215 (+) Transcript_27631:35-679(+)|eukprot:CAMPEP_0196811058 /NCGR_PEP_ID=MMETSP1362-20130617/16924_1 /TAXON_ID=163516 /ORGANISM="Leptocylindrus danicus, Strain CCMP1856" /LENGTH=214 /DNA_ID=CAMNT_0042186301 /DNA_START=34 /DNA_END=678 /DNA_ORIENTATION=-
MIASVTRFRLSFTSIMRASRLLSTSPNAKHHMVISALGEDRTGIVADMTKLVTDVGGNVGDSRAMKLGSHFSLMMLVSVPEAKVDCFKSSIHSVKDIETLAIETTVADSPTIVTAYEGKFILDGADSPGIVHKVTRLLAENGMNINDLRTSEESAPFGGTTLFSMEGMATVNSPLPKTFDPDNIRLKLADLGDSLNCDISLEDVEEESAAMYGM